VTGEVEAISRGVLEDIKRERVKGGARREKTASDNNKGKGI